MTNARFNAQADQFPSGLRRAAQRVSDGCALVAELTGHVAAALLLLLTLSIVMGIVLRWFQVENSWAFNLSTYALVWTAFVGAAYTALREQHVTAGIAIENVIGRATFLRVVRFAVLCVFLVLLAISGYRQALDSLVSHKTTLDLSQWPVWTAQAAVPVGAILWLVAATAIFLRQGKPAGEGPQEVTAPI